ncbi:hypothetical protein EV426DRAFT_701336 [Tirmania nivea]|nr:hypothetical protein EV426DRAFT_701336 [Tirmania nivea]
MSTVAINPRLYSFLNFLKTLNPRKKLSFPFSDSSGVILDSDWDAWNHLAVFVYREAHKGGYNAVHQYIARRYGVTALKKLRSLYGVYAVNGRALFNRIPDDVFDYSLIPRDMSIEKFVRTCSTYLNEPNMPRVGDVQALCALAYELVHLEEKILTVIDDMRNGVSPEEKEIGYLMVTMTQKEVEKVIANVIWDESRKRVFEESLTL